MARETWWLGSLAGAGERLDLGPEHPSRAGALELGVELAGDRIAAVEVRPGLVHRGAEKLFEVRDYRQGLALADRHDWQAPIFGELSLALAVEAALGIQPSPRSTLLRTLGAEHLRAHALLGQLSFLADVTALREDLRGALAAWTGNRLHPMVTRIGGVAADVDDAWCAAERALARRVAEAGDALAAAAAAAPAGLGVLTATDCEGLGLSGPVARAAGVTDDLRVTDPALAYPDLAVAPVTASAGDARARLLVMAGELGQSARLIGAALDRLPGAAGPLAVRLPKIVRLPEGEWYRPLEAPFGEAGLRVVSRGEKTPWRVHLRTPSLPNVMALERALPGTPVPAARWVVASLPYVIGDVDK